MSNILPFRQLLNEVDFCFEIKKLQFHAHVSNLNILYTQLQGDQQFLFVLQINILGIFHISKLKSG